MIQEEKAKAYDEAIKRAKNFIENGDEKERTIAESIFAGIMEESEDERIRKELLEHCKNQAKPYIQTGNKCPQIQSWIDWLEKQGEPKLTGKFKPKFNFKVGEWIVATGKCIYLIDKIDGFNVTLVDTNGDKYVFDASSLDDAHEWTIKDAKDGDILMSRAPFIYGKQRPYGGLNWYNGKFIKASNYTFKDSPVHPATKEQCKLLFSKMHEAGYTFEKKELKKIEQKAIDKIELKFRNGQWIVWEDKCYKVVYNGCGYELVDQNGLRTLLDYGTIDENAHLWTIQDAKDGDILFQDLMGGKTFIYNGINPEMAILYSFIISNDGKDVLPYHVGKPNTGIGNIEENKNIIHPATKEQRCTLMKALSDAGYTFDFDEIKHKFDVGDIIYRPSNSSCPVHSSTDGTLCTVIEVLDDHYILDTKKGRIQESFAWQDYYELVKKNITWSDEDKKMIAYCIDIFEKILKSPYVYAYTKDCLSWLNSIKDVMNT